MALTMNSQVRFWNSCIAGMDGPIDIEPKGGKPIIHDHDHDRLVTKVRCNDLPDSDQGDFRCWLAID